MPTIENYAEHPYHFPKGTTPLMGPDGKPKDGALAVTTSGYEEGILFPRAGAKDDTGNRTPSRKNVSDETLAAMKKHPVARGWFNRNGLAVAASDGADHDPKNEDALGGTAKAKQRQ